MIYSYIQNNYDVKVPTRENNTLDITLANNIAVENNVQSKVMHKLSSATARLSFKLI